MLSGGLLVMSVINIAARAFLINNLPEKKLGVAMYPILLFYLFIGMLVLYI